MTCQLRLGQFGQTLIGVYVSYRRQITLVTLISQAKREFFLILGESADWTKPFEPCAMVARHRKSTCQPESSPMYPQPFE